MNWLAEIEQTVTGLGYAVVEIERVAGGLLRVYIEHPDGVRAITVDDCERVTRQVQYLLEVQQVDYQRLEVSSPGLDRPLKSEQDFERFLGSRIELTFKQPVEMLSTDGKGSYKQKKFIGRLQSVDEQQVASDSSDTPNNKWVLVLEQQVDKKQGSKNSRTKKKTLSDEPAIALGFVFDEVREARLVPEISFKGNKTTTNSDVGNDGELPVEQILDKNGDRD